MIFDILSGLFGGEELEDDESDVASETASTVEENDKEVEQNQGQDKKKIITKDKDNNNGTTIANQQSSNNGERNKFILRVAVGTTNPCKIDAVKQVFVKVVHQLPDRNVTVAVEGFDVSSGISDQPMGNAETKLGAKNRAKRAHVAYKEKFGTLPHLSVGCEGGLEVLKDDVEDDLVAEEMADPTEETNNETMTSMMNGNSSTSGSTSTNTNSPNPGHEIHHKSTSQQQRQSQKLKKQPQQLWCMAWMAIYGKRQAQIVDVLASSESDCYFGDTSCIFSCSKTASFLLPPPVTSLIVQKGMELGHADDAVFQRTNSKQGSGTVGILTAYNIMRSDYYEHAILLALIPWIRPDVYPRGFTC